MRLEAEGKARLEAMKKALAAGVPLAGLLAGMACATEAVAGNEIRTMGAPMPLSLLQERRGMGQRPPEAAMVDEGRAKDPKGTETPEGGEKPEIPAKGEPQP